MVRRLTRTAEETAANSRAYVDESTIQQQDVYERVLHHAPVRGDTAALIPIDAAVGDTICAICHDTLPDSQPSAYVRLRDCAHTFHRECISRHFELNSACPYCRRRYPRPHNVRPPNVQVGYNADYVYTPVNPNLVDDEILDFHDGLEQTWSRPGDVSAIAPIPSLGASEDICVICQENEPPCDVVLSECCHRFHRPCISQYLQSENTCPTCRHPYPQRDTNEGDSTAAPAVVVAATPELAAPAEDAETQQHNTSM